MQNGSKTSSDSEHVCLLMETPYSLMMGYSSNSWLCKLWFPWKLPVESTVAVLLLVCVVESWRSILDKWDDDLILQRSIRSWVCHPFWTFNNIPGSKSEFRVRFCARARVRNELRAFPLFTHYFKG